MKNNKGFTLVEVLVSLSLVAVIAIFLFQIIYLLRDIYVEKAVKSELYIQSSNLSNVINREIVNKSKEKIYIKLINKISDDEVALTYSNNTKSNIKIDRENHSISFGNYNIKILAKADIGNIELYYNYDNISLDKNGICNIKIPITHKDYKNDFGVVVTYRYDSSKTTVNGTPGAVADVGPTPVNLGQVWEFDYNGTNGSDGSVQIFTVPETGTYKIETWGAQGGKNSNDQIEGYGGYSVGSIRLTDSDKLYIAVGGSGISASDTVDGFQVVVSGGYNGGGNAKTWIDNKTVGSGGGATHVALNSNRGELKNYASNASEIIIVAGGGGGTGVYDTNQYGGSGGGFKGNNGYAGGNTWVGDGGTQTSGGAYDGDQSITIETNSGFGQGMYCYANYIDTYYGNSSGGGGGYYGGACGAGNGGFGGGGSGYIGNSSLTDKKMVCYNCEENNDKNTKTQKTTCVNSNPTSSCAKIGNGYVKITMISE